MAKMQSYKSPPSIADLSHELLCHILQYLPLKEALSVSILCRKLSSAVDMHLRLCKCIDFCQGKIYGYMPSSITDDHMHYLLKKCPHLETVYGLHPLKVERRRLRKRSALTVPGIIEALSLCSNLKAIETCDLRLLEAVMQHLPQLEIIGHFRNRDGVFPPHASQRLKLQPYPCISSLHLIGVEVPELTAMPHLQHLHMQCVRFTKLQPFRAFLAQNLKTFVMKHCMGPSMSLRYLSLIIALSSSPSLSRLELVRVPLVGGLFQRAVEDSYRHNGFVNLKTLVIAGCKGVLEADLGHLMIVASKNLESLFIQPSLTKDSLFVSLSFAQCEFPKLKNLHLGFVDKLNSSGEWSNDVLLTIGLAEVPDTPSSLTDSGMKVISELFPNVKTMSVCNCPHLMAMDQWSPSEGEQAWKELTDLTLQRCHCLQLPSFALFLALLPKIEVVILNDMFREPPKGCSHVGLSAGTGLGMSSAVVSNQDEHIAVQGHQQDFEPQADEQLLENEEIDGEYIEIDNEGHHENHLMVMEQDFFDEQNNALHAPEQQGDNLNEGNRDVQIAAPNVAESNMQAEQHMDVEGQQNAVEENVYNGSDDCYPDVSQPSTSKEKYLPEKRNSRNNNPSTSSNHNKYPESKKKAIYPSRQTYQRKCKESKLSLDNESQPVIDVLPSTYSNSVLKNEDENTFVDSRKSAVASHSTEVVQSEMQSPSPRKKNLRSSDCGKHNACAHLDAKPSPYLRSRNFDPNQPSTSKAASYFDYSSSSSNSEIEFKNFKSSTEKVSKHQFSGKRPLKVSSQDKINYTKRVRKLRGSGSPENIQEDSMKTENNYISSNNSNGNAEVFRGPLTRHRRKILASGIKAEPLSHSAKTHANSKRIHERESVLKPETSNDSFIKIENSDSNSSSSSSSSDDDEYPPHRNLAICSGVLPPRPHLNCHNSYKHKHHNKPAYCKYQSSLRQKSRAKNKVANSPVAVPPLHKKEVNDSHPQSNVPAHSSNSNFNRGNEEASVQKEWKTRAPSVKKNYGTSKCETGKFIKNKKPDINQRPLTRHQERMLSVHEELDAISEGTQATSADIRRSVRRQKTSGIRPKKVGNAQATAHSAPRHENKISAREKHKKYKQSGSQQDVQNKATSTSDPLLEDDAIQTLRLVSETLISLTIVSCGVSDVVIDHCHCMTHIEVQACRILKNFQLHYCPSLKRLNISQCPKLNVQALFPEVLSLITDGSLLVSFEPCMQGYHPMDGEKTVFSRATSDQSIVLLHDFIGNSSENAEAVCKENLLGWMEFLQRIISSFEFPRKKNKKKKLKSDEQLKMKFPYGHDLRRLYGHCTFPQLNDWRYEILTNNYLFTAAVELVDWNSGFPGHETFKDYNAIFTLIYEAIERHLEMQKKLTAFYVPITENN